MVVFRSKMRCCQRDASGVTPHSGTQNASLPAMRMQSLRHFISADDRGDVDVVLPTDSGTNEAEEVEVVSEEGSATSGIEESFIPLLVVVLLNVAATVVNRGT